MTNQLYIPGEIIHVDENKTISCPNNKLYVSYKATSSYHLTSDNVKRNRDELIPNTPIITPLNISYINITKSENEEVIIDINNNYDCSYNINLIKELQVGVPLIGIIGYYNNISNILQQGYYKVYISGYGLISYLHHLSFNGASKKNKPSIKYGDVVYCIVKSIPDNYNKINQQAPAFNLDIQPISNNVIEVTCISDINTKDWSTSECLYGVLNKPIQPHNSELEKTVHGLLLQYSTKDSHLLYDNTYDSYLSYLGEIIPIELTIGLNGFSYLKVLSKQSNNKVTLTSQKVTLTSYIALKKCLELIPKLNLNKWIEFVNKIFNK